MSDADRPRVTPRKLVEGKLSNIRQRRDATRTMIGTNQKASRNTVEYLNGYHDALNLVVGEIQQLADQEMRDVALAGADRDE